MNQKEFSKIVEGTLEEIKQTLIIKGKEYSHTSDRLKNFKDAGQLLEESPEMALMGFVTKHIVALKDFVIEQELDSTKYAKGRDAWMEKTGDIICYMILLRALLSERGIL